jgi:signal transduction histidine kinase
VEDILDIGQLKSGKFRKVISKFNVKKAVEEIMQIQQYSADLRNVKMAVEYINFSVGDQQNYLIKTDKKRLQQVLLNLQSNALKFTKSGGNIKITVQLVK